jgi:hypothetical protein
MKQSPACSRRGSALILIEHIDPAIDAEDQLETDLVKMHHVGHRAVRHPDMRSNHRAAEPRGTRSRYSIPARPIIQGAWSASLRTTKACSVAGQHHRWIEFVDLYAGAVRGNQFALALGKAVGILCQDTQGARRFRSPLLDADPQPVARKDRHFRVIRRIDHVQTHLQRLGIKRQVVPQLRVGSLISARVSNLLPNLAGKPSRWFKDRLAFPPEAVQALSKRICSDISRLKYLFGTLRSARPVSTTRSAPARVPGTARHQASA